MKKAAGFTLIELVIVIVILGILGAVAAPRFINLQDDAYGANINSLKGSIQSAMSLANTKAILENKDNGEQTGVTGYSGVTFQDGYPIAASGSTGILGALQEVPSDDDYVKYVNSGENILAIQPAARSQGGFDNVDTCFVKYTQASGSTPASVDYNTSCE